MTVQPNRAVDAHAGDVDPQIKRFVETMSAAYARYPDFSTITVEEARRICEAVRAPWVKGGPSIAATTERTIPTRAGEVRLRIYDPEPERTKPALAYLHGGGWTVFSLDTHDRLMREYAHRGRIAVVGIDYARSPEAKFPTALEQTVDALIWLQANAAGLSIDANKLAIGGDSAGANLSIAAALMLRDVGRAKLLNALVLNYGVFDVAISEASARRYGGKGYMLTADEMDYFFNNYTRSPKDLDDPLVRPVKADLRGLPPCLLIVPECDVLTEQSFALSEKLLRANVPVEAKIYEGATHSFLEAMSIADVSNRAISDTTAWLRRTLSD
ncbi:MAG: alpha/beta hydrolase [Alphaproteobacteria bacterium]|nr:alpha/beta hydrolase [Alphaproteobacteria bacterium]